MARLSENFRSPLALVLFAGTTLLGLIADLLTKRWAFERLVDSIQRLDSGQLKVNSHTVEFIPGWLHFYATTNQGAVFGLGQGKRWLFVAVSILAIAFLTWLFASSGRRRGYQLILGMLLAGVLGNMYDRIVHGYVRDMIHALPDWKWPGWMIRTLPDWHWKHGDVGVFLMVVHSLFFDRRKSPSDQALAPADQRR
jgi:signal peptidase II